MNPFEHFMLVRYVSALCAVATAEWKQLWRSSELDRWFAAHGGKIGLSEVPRAGSDDLDVNVAGRRACYDGVRQLRLPATEPVLSPLQRRLDWLSETVGLDERDRSILGLVARICAVREVNELYSALTSDFTLFRFSGQLRPDLDLCLLSRLLRMPVMTAAFRVTSAQPLGLFALLEERNGDVHPGDALLRIVHSRSSDPARLRKHIFGVPRRGALNWTEFAHLGEDGERVAEILAQAGTTRALGINILLYGSPGTGKTAFASALACKVGLDALFVGERGGENGEPGRNERIGALALAQKMTATTDRHLLVVDEAEDIFVGVDDATGASRRGAKIYMNNLVERNRTPTIWITNHPELLGPAVLRRMTYALAFPDLDRASMERIVRRTARRHRLALDKAEVATISALKAPPALINSGMKVARMCAGGGDAVVRSVASVLKVMGMEHEETGAPADVRFDPAFTNADMDLDHLAERITSSGRTDISLCLAGAPGTGKSAFARHLARRMGLEVMERRASDLLGMYVGQSERNIAACFREAEARKAFLIFDEADSLLTTRSRAHQSYEVRMVNEVLTWLERHNYPVSCSTNHVDVLDPAATRRFLFKVSFMPMTVVQARAMFQSAFGMEAPRALDDLEQLTPGDFAVVVRKAQVLAERDPDVLVGALAAEVAAKHDAVRIRPIGFRAN